MNAHQRRKFMNDKHSRLPLGSEVMFRGQVATVFKHSRTRPHCLILMFDGGTPQETTRWACLSEIKPVLRLKVRPWYRGNKQ